MVTTFVLIALGALAGLLADRLGMPLPYMVGPLLSVGAVALALPHWLPAGYGFPARLRLIFIAVIGLIIGAQVTPELFAGAERLVISFAALALFVGLCQGFNYWVFRRLGGCLNRFPCAMRPVAMSRCCHCSSSCALSLW